MKILCIDTQILVWGVQKTAKSEADRKMVRKATAFLKALDEQKTTPYIPAIVVGELLIPVPPERHAKALDILGRRFRIVPYDAAAAAEFARIWQLRKADKTLDLLKANATRSALKADLMILATAISCCASILYTNDGPLTTLAKGLILTRELPAAPPEQTKLFEAESGRAPSVPEGLPLSLPSGPASPEADT